MKTTRVVVVGAGIAGLGAAYWLQKRGCDVQLIEADNVVGGRARTLVSKKNGDRCDAGTQFYHSNFPRALSLIDEVGLADTRFEITAQMRIYDDRLKNGSFLLDHNKPYIAPLGPLGNLRLGAFMLHRLLRHRIAPYELEDLPHLDNTRALDVTNSSAVRWMIDVLSKLGNNGVYEDINLYQIMRLIRIDFMTDYITLTGGVASLHQALGERLNVRLECPAESLVLDGGKVNGVILAGSGEVLRADHVVMAVPPPQAAAILPEEWKEEREFLRNCSIPAFTMPCFFLDRPLEKNVWAYFFKPDYEGKYLMASDASQKVPAMAPSGNGILQAWSPAPWSESVVKLSDHDVIETSLKEMEAFFPGVSNWVEEAHVTRHPVGVPQFPVGQGGRALDFLKMVDKRSGISFCGDFLASGFMEASLWSSERAIEGVVP